jgi:hypothetical protein
MDYILVDSKLSVTSIILIGSEVTEIILNINNLKLDNNLKIINEEGKDPGETILVLKISSTISKYIRLK